MPLKFCVSEAEAKTKWCPMVRQLGTLIGRRDATEDDRTVAMGSQNRGYIMGRPLENTLCIASDCMMWRFIETNINDGKGGPMEPSFNVGDVVVRWDDSEQLSHVSVRQLEVAL